MFPFLGRWHVKGSVTCKDLWLGIREGGEGALCFLPWTEPGATLLSLSHCLQQKGLPLFCARLRELLHTKLFSCQEELQVTFVGTS